MDQLQLEFKLNNCGAVNVPSIDSQCGIGCTYDEKTDSFRVNSTNPDGSTKLNIKDINSKTNEGKAFQIAELLENFQIRGFQQGRKHIRMAMGFNE